jgi:hypothetical protein
MSEKSNCLDICQRMTTEIARPLQDEKFVQMATPMNRNSDSKSMQKIRIDPGISP